MSSIVFSFWGKLVNVKNYLIKCDTFFFTYIYLQFYKHIKQSTSFNKEKGTELIV